MDGLAHYDLPGYDMPGYGYGWRGGDILERGRYEVNVMKKEDKTKSERPGYIHEIGIVQGENAIQSLCAG